MVSPDVVRTETSLSRNQLAIWIAIRYVVIVYLHTLIAWAVSRTVLSMVLPIDLDHAIDCVVIAYTCSINKYIHTYDNYFTKLTWFRLAIIYWRNWLASSLRLLEIYWLIAGLFISRDPFVPWLHDVTYNVWLQTWWLYNVFLTLQ